MSSYSQNLYRKRREKGLCTRCGKPAMHKEDGTTTKLCKRCRTLTTTYNENKRKRDAELMREFKKAHISFEDLKIFIDRTDKPTIDARICTCDGVYYPEYSFCPWCGRKVK